MFTLVDHEPKQVALEVEEEEEEEASEGRRGRCTGEGLEEEEEEAAGPKATRYRWPAQSVMFGTVTFASTARAEAPLGGETVVDPLKRSAQDAP